MDWYTSFRNLEEQREDFARLFKRKDGWFTPHNLCEGALDESEDKIFTNQFCA
jgi:hypothetical protein